MRSGEGPGVLMLSWLNYFTQYLYKQVFHLSVCRVLSNEMSSDMHRLNGSSYDLLIASRYAGNHRDIQA